MNEKLNSETRKMSSVMEKEGLITWLLTFRISCNFLLHDNFYENTTYNLRYQKKKLSSTNMKKLIFLNQCKD